MKLIAINCAGRHDNIREPQDVEFFPSVGDVEREFEPWFSEEPYLAVDSDGARYVFVAADPYVQLKPKPDEARDPGLYRAFAESMLRTYFTAKEIELERQPKFEELSLDNLNAFVYALLVDRFLNIRFKDGSVDAKYLLGPGVTALAGANELLGLRIEMVKFDWPRPSYWPR